VSEADAQREYAAALKQYRRAMRRIIEAKRHIPPSPRDLRRQELREERERERQWYLDNKETIDRQHAELRAELSAATATEWSTEFFLDYARRSLMAGMVKRDD